jgi:arylsulfatase A-like enzyme
MQNNGGVSRRTFLERMTAGALLGAAGAHNKPALAESGGGSWSPPPALTSPNILVVLVDQMRLPIWMTAKQLATLKTTVLPNIMGRIAPNSYSFEQFFAAATICTSARAALLTGLYSPQTAMYLTGSGSPSLNPAYPTWAEALAALNPAYRGNVWWFGKWHLSNSSPFGPAPLLPYGFHTRTYPGGLPPYNPDPIGDANEGTGGGLFEGLEYASDAMIANDFIGWLQGQPPSNGEPSSPWCATVSLVNPHDIAYAPAWLEDGPFPPSGVPLPPVYFPPPSENSLSFYARKPSPWNYEDLLHVPNKPALQKQFLTKFLDKNYGVVKDWMLFLNQYFWLQNFVDKQVGLVLDALADSTFANNTVIVFLADHGEYAGSHGLHDKGRAVYDEAIRVPFYVQFPGQAGAIAMNQMCSGVDFFGLICDLATGGNEAWAQSYPDLGNRQAMWNFLYYNSTETRVAPAPVGLPYIFHTSDDRVSPMDNGGNCHIVCLRTKLDLNAGQIGAKLAFYSEWSPCTTYPSATPPDPEFYDYNPQTTNNTSELGNDYFSANSAVQNTIAQYAQVMGSLAPPATGLIASELNPPLIGKGTDGNPLSQAQAAAQQAYFEFYKESGCAMP